MQKKTWIATAALAAIALSATAAQVEVYGRIDTGLSYTHTKYTDLGQSFSDDKFSMDSGNSTSSRWGLRGSEDLGNGLKAGFVLENGFGSDTGALGGSQLFNRESTLWLEGGFGRVYAGRMTSLMSDAGSVGFYGAAVSPFGTGWGEMAGHAAVMASYETSRYDNALAYVSPSFAGVTIYAQYAMGTNDNENESTSDRYFALGASYANGPLQLAGVVDYLNKQSSGEYFEGVEGGIDPDDQWTFNLGGSYDFEVAKIYGAVQYYKNAVDIGQLIASIDAGNGPEATVPPILHSFASMDGYAINIGADVALAGGLFKVSAGYMNAEMNDFMEGLGGDDLTGYNVMAGYEYPMSRRTNIYAGMGFTKYKIDYIEDEETDKKEVFQAMLGLVHKF